MATGTARTIAQLYAIFDDNITGDISPQDLRDFVATMEDRTPVSTIVCAVDSSTAAEKYMAGMYLAPAADTNLSQASATQAYGSADTPYAAHVFAVIGGTPATTGSTLTLTVSGVSINDAGARNGADAEILFTGTPASLSTDDYFESSKKWLGAVTYTLTSDGGTFNLDFNYGFCKYNDFGNRDFTLDGFEFEFEAVSAIASCDIEVLHHKATGWTYSAAAFVPGSAFLYSMDNDHSTANTAMASGEKGFYKRADLSDAITGETSEGFLVRVTTGATNDIGLITGNIYIKPTA